MTEKHEMSFDEFVSAFNQISRIITFESNQNTVSTMVSSLEVRHINAKDTYVMEKLDNYLIKPETITAKYQVWRNFDKTSRSLIFLYKVVDDPVYFLNTYTYDIQKVFNDDIESSYIFIPESKIIYHSDDEDNSIISKTVKEIFMTLLTKTNYLSINSYDVTPTEDYINRNLGIYIATVLTHLIINTTEFPITDPESKSLYDALSDHLAIGSFGAPELQFGQDDFSKDNIRFLFSKILDKLYNR